MAPRELCMDLEEKQQTQLRMCQDMWHAVEQGQITKEEYDQFKRKLILALSKPVAGSQHAASAPSRLALLTELKNSGCILEIEYQWARVPILCQIDLVRQPRKENREPPEDRLLHQTTLTATDKKDQRTGAMKAPKTSASASPLGPSKYGPNTEASSQHPLAPWTKEAFLQRRAALSGDESQPSKGKQVKRQPSFAGLGQARRSASFSAGDSVASDASNRKPAPAKKDVRSSLSVTSSPVPQPARKGFARSLSFSNGRSEEAYESRSLDKQSLGEDGRETFQGVSFTPRLPPLAHTRRPSLLATATGLVRKSRKGSFALNASLTDSETGERLTCESKKAPNKVQDDVRRRVWESEPETCTKGKGDLLKAKKFEEANNQVKSGIWSEDEGRAIGLDTARLKERRLRQGGCTDDEETLRPNGSRVDNRGNTGGQLEALNASAQTKQEEAIKGRRCGTFVTSGCESFEGSSQQSDSCEDQRGWFDKLKLTRTTNEQKAGLVHKSRVRSEAFHSAESGFESTGGSQYEVPRVKNRTASKVARRLMGNGHVLLKDWNRKLAGLLKDKQAGRSVSASEDEGARVSSRRSGEGPSSLHQEVRQRVYCTLDTWRHEACGRQSAKRFLTEAQMTRLAEMLPQTVDELQPLLPQHWIDRYGLYVLSIVRDTLDTAQLHPNQSAQVTSATSAGLPQRVPPQNHMRAQITSAAKTGPPRRAPPHDYTSTRVTSAAKTGPPRRAPPQNFTSAQVTSAAKTGPPRRAPPPLPLFTSECNVTSETDRSMTSQSDAKVKRHSTWARRKGATLEVEVTCLPMMTEESDEDLDVFSPGTGPLPQERLGNPRAGHASRRDYLRRSQEKALRRSLDNLSKIKAGDWT